LRIQSAWSFRPQVSLHSLNQLAFDLMAIWQLQREVPGKMWVGMTWDLIQAREEAQSSMDTLIAQEALRQSSGVYVISR